jgi:ribosome-associated heat shock protein Hsp15
MPIGTWFTFTQNDSNWIHFAAVIFFRGRYNRLLHHFFTISVYLMSDTVRIDKWLWATRFFKTRTLASHAVEAGKVRVNGEHIKPARSLKLGELVDIDNGATIWQVRVLGLSETRGSAVVAHTLYAETEQSLAKRQLLAENNRYFREPGATLKGRPTKRDRRLMDKTTS